MNLLHKMAAWNEAGDFNAHGNWQTDKSFREAVDSPIYGRPYRWISAIASKIIPGLTPYKEYDMGSYKAPALDTMAISHAMTQNRMRPQDRGHTVQEQILDNMYDRSYKRNAGVPYGRWV